MAEQKLLNSGIDVIAITNEIVTQNMKVSSILENSLIEYGLGNLYPSRVFEIFRNSPTAGGCSKRKAEFLFGLGIENGDFVVNRHGETLNDIYNIVTRDFSKMDGYVLHFNTNLLGEIVEIQNVDIRYIRKLGRLKSVRLARNRDINHYDDDAYEIALYGQQSIKDNGFIYYFNNSGGIYPVCPMEASLTSAQFENESQVFSLMSAENGFSASGVLKLPNMPDDGDKKEKIKKEIQKVVGSRNAGSILIVNAPQNIEGETDNAKMFEPFQLSNVDAMHTNQTMRAREYILRDFNMPEILLGVGSSGMFNKESFEDAFNYYNNDTKRDRTILENSFNSFWDNTIFNELKEIKIIPLEEMGIAEPEEVLEVEE